MLELLSGKLKKASSLRMARSAILGNREMMERKIILKNMKMGSQITNNIDNVIRSVDNWL
jgi:histidyl-tRNA synthetase